MKRQETINENDSDTETKKSCPTKLQEDITKSLNQEEYRAVKSQQFLPHYEDFIVETDECQRKEPKKQTLKKQSFREKPGPQTKIDIKIINKIGTDFDCQKVESVQFSLEQASYRSGSLRGKSNRNSQKQIEEPKSGKKSKKDQQEKPKNLDSYRKDELKEDILNVLLAGAQDTGKSTFRCCFKRKHRKADEHHIKSQTKEIKYKLAMEDENLLNKRNNIYFVDLAGFAPNEENRYLREIEQYATVQWRHFQTKPDEDRRIHCCLYFMRGPRIKDSDINVMKKLSGIFNLIPVIAKSDQYTKEEILEMKQEFHKKVALAGQIFLYDLEQFYLLKLGTDRINQALLSPFGKFPPFAVTSSFQRENGQPPNFVRKYPWGKVEIENKEHSDFEKLCELLTSDVRTQLLNKLIPLQQRQLEIEPKEDKNFFTKNKDSLIFLSCLGAIILSLKYPNYFPLHSD